MFCLISRPKPKDIQITVTNTKEKHLNLGNFLYFYLQNAKYLLKQLKIADDCFSADQFMD